MNALFRLLLTFNATSLMIMVYAVKSDSTLARAFHKAPYLVNLPNYVSYISYIVVIVGSTCASVWFSSFLGKDDFKRGDIVGLDHANNVFLPSYLGYFFVALSANNWATFLFVYSLVFVFTFRSRALYFNPIFLLIGFDFYEIRTKNGSGLFLISRNRYKVPSDVDVSSANRINDYTFIERG